MNFFTKNPNLKTKEKKLCFAYGVGGEYFFFTKNPNLHSFFFFFFFFFGGGGWGGGGWRWVEVGGWEWKE